MRDMTDKEIEQAEAILRTKMKDPDKVKEVMDGFVALYPEEGKPQISTEGSFDAEAVALVDDKKPTIQSGSEVSRLLRLGFHPSFSTRDVEDEAPTLKDCRLAYLRAWRDPRYYRDQDPDAICLAVSAKWAYLLALKLAEIFKDPICIEWEIEWSDYPVSDKTITQDLKEAGQ